MIVSGMQAVYQQGEYSYTQLGRAVKGRGYSAAVGWKAYPLALRCQTKS